MITDYLAPVQTNGRHDVLESDYLALGMIPNKYRNFEGELRDTKWFDYRYMTSAQATFQYVNEYMPIYRRIFGEHIDHARSQHLNLMNGEELRGKLLNSDPKAKRKFMGFWRGRQIADALGMKYTDYISLAIDFRMRHWKRRHLPQPEHLYHEWDVEKIQERWKEMQASRLYMSDHPSYMIENYTGTPYQIAYHEWLFKQANLRQNVPSVLARMTREGHLPMEMVRDRLSKLDFEYFEYHLQQPY